MHQKRIYQEIKQNKCWISKVSCIQKSITTIFVGWGDDYSCYVKNWTATETLKGFNIVWKIVWWQKAICNTYEFSEVIVMLIISKNKREKKISKEASEKKIQKNIWWYVTTKEAKLIRSCNEEMLYS